MIEELTPNLRVLLDANGAPGVATYRADTLGPYDGDRAPWFHVRWDDGLETWNSQSSVTVTGTVDDDRFKLTIEIDSGGAFTGAALTAQVRWADVLRPDVEYRRLVDITTNAGDQVDLVLFAGIEWVNGEECLLFADALADVPRNRPEHPLVSHMPFATIRSIRFH